MRKFAMWLCGEKRDEAKAEREAEIERLKAKAAKQTNPAKARRLAAKKLGKLGLVGLALCSCHSLTPEQQARLDEFECRVAAVSPLLCDILDPEEFVREVMLGRVNPTQALLATGAKLGDIVAAANAWNACSPAAPQVQVESQ